MVELWTNRSERLATGMQVRPPRRGAPRSIGPARLADAEGIQRWLVSFDGVNDRRRRPKPLRGAVLRAAAARRARRPVGARADRRRGRRLHGDRLLGVVQAVEANPASDLLVLDRRAPDPAALRHRIRAGPGRWSRSPPACSTREPAERATRSVPGRGVRCGSMSSRSFRIWWRHGLDGQPHRAGGAGGPARPPGPRPALGDHRSASVRRRRPVRGWGRDGSGTRARCSRAVEAVEPPRPLFLLGPGGRRFDQAWAAELAGAARVLAAVRPLRGGRPAGGRPPGGRRAVDRRLRPGRRGGGRSRGRRSRRPPGPGCHGQRCCPPRRRASATGCSSTPSTPGRPSFRGWEVPEVLRSGDHERVRRWRRAQALARTLARRPDLHRSTGGLTRRGAGPPGRVRPGRTILERFR